MKKTHFQSTVARLTSKWKMLVLAAFLAVAPLGLQSCFPPFYSFTGANFPDDVETFSVDFFSNEASLVNPQLSLNFTEKLKTKFQTQTKLGLKAEQGDYHFSGAITEYRIDPATLNADLGTAQNQFTIKVKVEFVCEKHPDKNIIKDFSFFKIYDANQPFESVEESLSNEITDNIVQQIFAYFALDW